MHGQTNQPLRGTKKTRKKKKKGGFLLLGQMANGCINFKDVTQLKVWHILQDMFCKVVPRIAPILRTLQLPRLPMMSTIPAKINGPLPDGVWPTMITPFINDGKKSVDYKGLDSK